MGFLALISAKTWAWLGIVAAVTAGLGGAYLYLDGRGYSRCERDTQLVQLHAQEEAHQVYLAEVARGDELSAELAKTQRRLNDTKTEYHRYANAITGVCDPSVRVLVEYASGAAKLPEATGPFADGPVTESAADLAYQAEVTRAIGLNIAENYARLDQCIAEKMALNRWHQPEGAVK